LKAEILQGYRYLSRKVEARHRDRRFVRRHRGQDDPAVDRHSGDQASLVIDVSAQRADPQRRFDEKRRGSNAAAIFEETTDQF
jgi:hypothetical protein